MRASRILVGSCFLAVFVSGALAGCGGDEPATGQQPSSEAGGKSNGGGGGKSAGGSGTGGKGSGGKTTDASTGAGGTSTDGSSGAGGSSGGGGGDSSVEATVEAGSLCGNNHLDPGEECDDGNTKDGDGCSSICTNKCEKCEKASAYCADFLTGCYALTGNATAGSATGAPKAELCSDLMACIRKSKCAYIAPPGTQSHPDGISGCFCGEGVTRDECLNTRSKPPEGPCKAEVEAAAESNDIGLIASRAFNPAYALGGAFSIVYQCDDADCPTECLSRYPFPDAGADSGR